MRVKTGLVDNGVGDVLCSIVYTQNIMCFSLTIYLVFRVRVNQREKGGNGPTNTQISRIYFRRPTGEEKKGMGGGGGFAVAEGALKLRSFCFPASF